MKSSKMFPAPAVCAAVLAAVFSAGCGKPTPPAKEYRPLLPKDVFAVAYCDYSNAEGPMGKFLVDQTRRLYTALAEITGQEALSDEDFAFLTSQSANRKWSLTAIGRPAFSAKDFEDDPAAAPIPPIVAVECLKTPTTTQDHYAFLCDAFRRGCAKDLEKDDDAREFCSTVTNLFAIVDGEVAGVPVKKLVATDYKGDDEDLAEAAGQISEFIGKHKGDLSPCMGVLGGTLVVFAVSEKTFADAVALYEGKADGMAADDEAAQDLAAAGPGCYIGFYDAVGMLKGLLGEDFDEMMDDTYGKMAASLGKVFLGFKTDDGEMTASYFLGAKFADENTATTLASLISGSMGLARGAAGLYAMKDPSLSFVGGLLDGFTATSDKGVLSVELKLGKSLLESIDYGKALKAAGVDEMGGLGMIRMGGDDDGDDDEDDDDDDDDADDDDADDDDDDDDDKAAD